MARWVTGLMVRSACRPGAGAGGPVAVTGYAGPGELLEDIEQARLSFRRALETLNRTGW